MNNYLTYSVLQYKHNLSLGESLNVGILFYFSDENIFEFVSGDGYRAKAIYPDFDNSLFNGYLKIIIEKVKKQIKVSPNGIDFLKFIHNNILREDAAGLIFKEPSIVKNVFENRKVAVEQYSRLLLPGILVEKPLVVKHNENYIIKKFNGYIFGQDKKIEKNFEKNKEIKTKHFNIKFDLSWQNATHNFIKPINFDFTDEILIQKKAAVLYCYITDLKEYAAVNQSRFDFLVSKPQNVQLNSAYENALDFLDSLKAPKRLITEDKLESYSQNILSELITN
jgi:hypothetical protein